MLKVTTVLPYEPYREYKEVEQVYSGSTEIDKILDKNGNALFAVNKEVEGTPALTYKGKEETNLKNYRIYGNTETKTRSYSGSAPLSFPITDGAVSNYRVYGNTVNGESVGDLVETGEHAGEYRVPVTVTNGTDTETTNLYLPEQIKMVGDEAEYVDYKEQKQHRVRKNLFNYNTHAGTIRGYLFNDDRCGLNDTWQITDYISCDGYVFTISPIGGNDPSICLYDKDKHFITGKNYDTGNAYIKTGVTITSDIKASFVRFSYKKVGNEQQVDDLSNIMLNSGSEPLPYEPYIENTEVDVTLPALPAQSTSNSLSIGTSVQPSSVAVDVAEVVSCGEKVTDSQSVNYGKYKIPLTLTADSAETTDIYLDEPLKKGSKPHTPDYIDYATQKRHNSDGTESSVTLPEIAVTAGTNTLTVGTEVQPSNVYLKGRIKEIS